ncbi:uncharacterized protein LOC103697786 isoform X2 [Phoenix dactylifera]|uniref:Uncharacterized protein LOC103697786 isoform X2 n=1 Tax=Phoenix dactylifera TaxID=42345 RepID=A0A8B7BIV4_PHODC|nr:uncharacterized protein LOC103697786 isoform X2 [Phoenix dactylifera]
MKSLRLILPPSTSELGGWMPSGNNPIRRSRTPGKLLGTDHPRRLTFPVAASMPNAIAGHPMESAASPSSLTTCHRDCDPGAPPPPPAAEATLDLRADSSADRSSAAADASGLEEQIEKVIYGCRFMTILGIAGSLMGSILCFLKGCEYVINSFADYFISGGRAILMLVEAIGTVMLVFGMGLYELFISNFDVAKTSSYGSNLLGLFKLQERPKWLEIQSVNELKTKVGHVIVMVLLVGLFDKSKKVTISTPNDLLCFAASILLSSGCLYLLSKLHISK